VGGTMQIEIKLLKILELIHNQKLRILNKDEILYTDLHNIYSKLNDVCCIVNNNRHKPEFFEVNGKFQEIKNIRTKGEQ
jgi:hypothetical protein